MGNNEMKTNGAIGTNSNIQEMELEEEGKKKEDRQYNTVPFHKLFCFADLKDIGLMVFGTVGAVANGMTLPLTTILFGNMIEAFQGDPSKHDAVKRVSKVSFLQVMQSYCKYITHNFNDNWFSTFQEEKKIIA
jgi:hypothetical protein